MGSKSVMSKLTAEVGDGTSWLMSSYCIGAELGVRDIRPSTAAAAGETDTG